MDKFVIKPKKSEPQEIVIEIDQGNLKMGDAEDFITGFHSLEGDLIGERKKSFYKLLKRPLLFSNENELNELFQQLKPKSYQESLFYLEALIYFKRTEQLKEILKSGNQLFATKIVKQTWFIEEAFKNCVAENLVKSVMPYLSYIVRKKLINGISKSWGEIKMDELFDALEKCYGLSAAVEILHKCSQSKIKKTLEDNEIKLKPNQVIELFKKSRDLLENYLRHFKQITNIPYSEKKVINYIALKQPSFLLELEKSKLVVISQIGRRTTNHIIEITKDEIACDVKHYCKFMNKSAIVRKFSPDFKTPFKQMFPNKFGEVNWNSYDIIKYYPKKRRWDLFYTTCTERFPNKSFKDILTSLDFNINNLEPSRDIIHQWAKLFYEKEEDHDEYLKYFPFSIAIQIIKEKIDVTSKKYKRQKLVHLLLENCAANKDMYSLEEVLKYISVRHKNEDADFRNELLSKIKCLFELTELNETHWKYIYEQIKIIKIRKEFNAYWLSDIVTRHLEFLFKNKLDHAEALRAYITEMIDESFYRDLDLKNPAIERDIYSEICKIYPDFVQADPENSRINTNKLIYKVITFSLNNKDHFILLKNYPYIVNEIMNNFNEAGRVDYNQRETLAKSIIYNETFPEDAIPIESCKVIEIFLYVTREEEKSIWWFSEVLEKIVRKHNRSELGNQLLKTYLEVLLEQHPEREVIPWLLRNEPKTLVPYFEKALKEIVASGTSLDYKLIKQYSHFDFDQKTKEYFRQQLDLIKRTEHAIINTLLEGLVVLLSTDDFINIVEKSFLPKNDKLDLEDEEMRDLYKIQSNLAKMLSKVAEPYRMLPTVMKFARGDFLQLALPALYGTFYNSPQRILYSYVEQLSKQAISARKHAIFLSCAVLDKEHTINLLKNTKESNISSQKHLFAATLKYFLRNPSEVLLAKVIENMSTIDKNDSETLDSLKNVHIPTKYRHTYIEQCWRFFENMESSGVKVKGYLEKLLDYMCDDILVSLSEEFVIYVTKQYFHVQTKERLSRVDNFVVIVLKSRKSERNQIFKLVFEIASKFDKRVLNDFFNSFLEVAREKNVGRNFVQLFSDHWNANFTIILTLEQHIALKLLLLRLDNCEVEKYSHGVVEYMDQLISEFGFLVLSIFKNQLVCALATLELKDRLIFYLAMLKQKSDSYTSVLILQSLDYVNQEDDDEDEEVKRIYKNVKNILQNVDIPIVKAYCKSYLIENLS